MNFCLILTPCQKLLQVNKRPSVLLRKYSMCFNLVAAYNWTTPYTYSRVRADMRERASTRACASRAPFAHAHERPGNASHLLATRTRLSSYL